MRGLIRPIKFYNVDLADGFWRERRELNSRVTLRAVYDRFVETGRFAALGCDWNESMDEALRPHYFWDSDVAKWIEGAANILRTEPDVELESLCDAAIDDIIRNQWDDGYFNTYFTVVEPERRFQDRDKHELYCAGHLMEAAAAYYEATGKRAFLDAMCRYADYIELRFKINRDAGFITPGHQEIELALFRLWDCTGERRYFELAEFFINERGVNDKPLSPTATLEYNQSHKPVREQREAVGHAVRAAYLYAAMAELAKRTDDEALFEACDALFDNISGRKMYITGGVGSSASGEAYTEDYDLPNILSYGESCAGIGLIFFAARMSALAPDSKYAEVIERVLYNNFLSCTSIDGDSFFYTNPLEVIPYLFYKDKVSKYYKIKYPKPSRSRVFKTSCCPPNVVRFVPTIPELIFGDDGETLFVHQFIGAECDVRRGGKSARVKLKTDYPKDGRVEISIHGADLKIAVRIPSWHRGYTGKTEKGYAYLSLKDGESVVFDFDMSVRLIEANPRVLFDSCKCAVMRGPVVYCSESVDNGELLRNLRLDISKPITEGETPAGYASPTLNAAGSRRAASEQSPLYFDGDFGNVQVPVRLIPYHAFSNRGECEMQVWMGYKN